MAAGLTDNNQRIFQTHTHTHTLKREWWKRNNQIVTVEKIVIHLLEISANNNGNKMAAAAAAAALTLRRLAPISYVAALRHRPSMTKPKRRNRSTRHLSITTVPLHNNQQHPGRRIPLSGAVMALMGGKGEGGTGLVAMATHLQSFHIPCKLWQLERVWRHPCWAADSIFRIF